MVEDSVRKNELRELQERRRVLVARISRLQKQLAILEELINRRLDPDE